MFSINMKSHNFMNYTIKYIFSFLYIVLKLQTITTKLIDKRINIFLQLIVETKDLTLCRYFIYDCKRKIYFCLTESNERK